MLIEGWMEAWKCGIPLRTFHVVVYVGMYVCTHVFPDPLPASMPARCAGKTQKLRGTHRQSVFGQRHTDRIVVSL